MAIIVKTTGVAACKHISGPKLRGFLGTQNVNNFFWTDPGKVLEAAHVKTGDQCDRKEPDRVEALQNTVTNGGGPPGPNNGRIAIGELRCLVYGVSTFIGGPALSFHTTFGLL